MARAGFYVLLAYLAAAVAGGWSAGGRQANANGALQVVAGSGLGRLALVGAAAGFLAFAAVRAAGAIGDRRPSGLRRLTTLGQAAFYLVMAAGTAAFLFGNRQTGSEQQQEDRTAAVLAAPAGRWLVAGIGLAVLVVCGWQVRLAFSGGFADSLRTEALERRARRAVRWLGGMAIAGRALAVAPVGVFLVLAAVRADPRQSKGLDAYLAELTRPPLGRGIVWCVAAGFLAFAAYTVVEARYRAVDAGD
ncbi:MAG TPA: DUF1206 domain-containing protein [Mycobacteriales bacterium]